MYSVLYIGLLSGWDIYQSHLLALSVSWFCLLEEFFLELGPDSTALARKEKAGHPVGQLPFLL